MKEILSVIILLFVGSGVSYANGIEGTWKAKMQGPNGDMDCLRVQNDGRKIERCRTNT